MVDKNIKKMNESTLDLETEKDELICKLHDLSLEELEIK